MSNPPSAVSTTPSIVPSHAIQAHGPRSRGHSPTVHTSLLPAHAGLATAQGSIRSQTQTHTNTDTSDTTAVVLRLRGAHELGPRRVVQWAEGVVDNEGLGRKSSKGTFWRSVPSEDGVGAGEEARAAEPEPRPSPYLTRWEARLTRRVDNSMLHLPCAKGCGRVEFRRRLQFGIGVRSVR
jgi:hypothetical protein